MRVTRSAAGVCVLLVVASCGLTGPREFPHAVATFQCGPADGPATAILLSRDSIQSLQPAFPYVSVVIWHPVDSLAGTVWQIDDGAGHVTARYRSGPDTYQDAAAGTVRIERVGSDYRLDGDLDLRFPSLFVSDAFSAPWIESLALCG